MKILKVLRFFNTHSHTSKKDNEGQAGSGSELFL